MLNLKQKRFCEAFVRTGSSCEAYSEAYNTDNMNYCKSAGCRLMKNNGVKAYIAELNKKAEDKSIADINDCLKVLTELMTDDNKMIRLKATDMRLKTLAAYTENHNLNGDLNIDIGFDDE